MSFRFLSKLREELPLTLEMMDQKSGSNRVKKSLSSELHRLFLYFPYTPILVHCYRQDVGTGESLSWFFLSAALLQLISPDLHIISLVFLCFPVPSSKETFATCLFGFMRNIHLKSLDHCCKIVFKLIKAVIVLGLPSKNKKKKKNGGYWMTGKEMWLYW